MENGKLQNLQGGLHLDKRIGIGREQSTICPTYESLSTTGELERSSITMLGGGLRRQKEHAHA